MTRDEAQVSTLPIQNEYELVGSATYGRVVVYSKRAWVCTTRQGNDEHDADGEQQHIPEGYDSRGASQCWRGFGIFSSIRPPPKDDQPGKNAEARASNKHNRRTIRTEANENTTELHVDGLDPIQDVGNTKCEPPQMEASGMNDWVIGLIMIALSCRRSDNVCKRKNDRLTCRPPSEKSNRRATLLASTRVTCGMLNLPRSNVLPLRWAGGLVGGRTSRMIWNISEVERRIASRNLFGEL